MIKRALMCGVAVIAALPMFAANVASRTGTATTSLNVTPGSSTSAAVNWTVSAGTTYTSVSVAPLLYTSGGAASGSAYLSTGIGPSATVVGGPVAFSVPAGQTTPTATTITFTGVTLTGPATYYLTISNGSANLLWAAAGGGGTEALGTGVSAIGADVQDFVTPQPVNPPTSATFVSPVSAGGSTHVLLFSVDGTTSGGGGGSGSSSVPTLGEWAMFGTVLLLGASGVFMLKRRHQE